MAVRGWARGCESRPRGSELVADAASGATVLYVEDVTDFNDVGGALEINGQRVSYSDGAVDEDAGTITLDGGLTAAATTGDRVFTVSGGQVAKDKILYVSAGDGDEIEVTIPFSQRDLWPEGDYDDDVELTLSDDLERIEEVPGRTPIRILEDATAGDRVPAAPAALTLTTSAYLDGGSRLRAQVVVDWSDVTENVDGSVLENLDHYEVQIHAGLPTDAGTWTQVTRTDADTSVATLTGYTPGQVKSFRVRAVNTIGGKGDWSAPQTVTMAVDNTPPAQPSVPTLSAKLGTIIGRWDGKNSAGAAMDADLAYVEVHRSTTNGFTATVGNTATLIGRIGPGADFFIYSIADGATYNTTYYFKLIAVDTSNNASTPSGQASASMAPLVDTDLIGQVISGAHIVDGTIAAYDKIIGNTITGALIQALAINAGHINSNAITADKIDAGAVTAVKIAALAIDASKIAAGAISADKIAAGAITADKLSATAIDGKTISGVYITSGTIAGVGGIQSDYMNAAVNVHSLGTIDAVGNILSNADLHGSAVYADGQAGGSGNTNAVIGPSGQIKKDPSTLRLKKDVDLLDLDLGALRAVQALVYRIDDPNDPDDDPTLYPGLAAEQLHDLGLGVFVGYDTDGRPASVRYDKFTAGLLLLAQDHEERIAAQDARIDALEQRLTELQPQSKEQTA